MTSVRHDPIEPGYMVFLAEGQEGIGAVRSKTPGRLVIYVENAGEFAVPRSAVKSVHDQKVILDPAVLDEALLQAVGHTHDREDPNTAG
ncbi:MAG: hypothetical protein ABL901_07325 [Hyphomicrobiaceae bacterium]